MSENNTFEKKVRILANNMSTLLRTMIEHQNFAQHSVDPTVPYLYSIM